MSVPYGHVNEQVFKSKACLPTDYKLVHTRIMIYRVALCLFSCTAVFLSGCTQFPELAPLNTPALQNAPYGTLVPVDPILAGIDTAGLDTDAAAAQTQRRLDGLRKRVATLRRSGLTDQEEKRLRQGVR